MLSVFNPLCLKVFKMRGKSLGVLMWKHYMVRKRRFIHTALELFSPLVFFLILFVFRNVLKPQIPASIRLTNNDTMVKMTEEKFLDDDHDVPRPRFLLYTPDTKLAGILMAEVGERLKLPLLHVLPNKTAARPYKGYYPYTDISEIDDFVKDFYTNEAIVAFEDMDGEDWPDRAKDKLSYTIRMKNTFYTYTFKSRDNVPSAHQQFGDTYDEFMLLQWTIDTSYIKVRTGNTIPQALSLQEFPYYDSVRSSSVGIICSLLPIMCWMSLAIVFVFLMSRLLEERSTGIQELIKMVGVSSNTLGLSHFLNAVPTGLFYAVFGTVLLFASDNPLIEFSNGFIIFIALILHFVSVASMAMACSYLAKNTQYAVSISMFMYIILWIPNQLLFTYNTSHSLMLLGGILPHVPINWLWMEVEAFEQYNYGLTFDKILKSHNPASGPVLLGYCWLIIQSMLFFFITWYLSHVRPGTYGQPKPWNFLCLRQYWSKNEINPHSDMDEEEPIVRDKRFFEDPPKDMDVGIKIENISKFFPKHKALINVSLEVYKGEITILLGHNGAGKTTLMSIITGMMSATDGKVYVNGVDSVKHPDEVRSQLGLCPQHNLFFPDLTVLEHAIFFTMLKGGTYRDARKSSMELLHRLGISNKADSKSSELSGGMKRRLQLACALAGGASVLVLDEPTSGLDVETRRELWDLLLSLRGERTVLLTTHFMEEADALGDRVAALHSGQLRCHATTMYLKKAIGTGYRLSFTTNGVPRDHAITSVVTSIVHDASLKEKSLNSLSYNLPAAASKRFPKLFSTLEKKRSELGIETIGVGVSTLEEVFLKLCSDTDASFTDDEVDSGRIEPTYNKVNGCSLFLRQFCVLFKRQYRYITSKAMSFLILQILLPIIVIFLFTSMSNNFHQPNTTQPSIALDLDLYKQMPERKVLYNVVAAGASPRGLDDTYPSVVFTNEKQITDAILRTGKQSILEYNKYLVGVELNDTHAKALYTTVYRHAAPVAMNLLSNLLASQYLPASDGRTIVTYNHPIDGSIRFDDPLVQAKSTDLCLMWSVLTVFIILSSNINFASLPCRERVSGSRHLHVMAGCAPALHWACTLTVHMLAALPLLAAVSIAAVSLDTDHTFTQPRFLLTLMLILTLGNLAFFAFMYIVSFNFAERATGIILVAVMMVFGLVTTSLKTAYGLFSQDMNWFLRIFLALATYVMPPHALTIAAAKCVYVARLNAMCTLNRARCPNLAVAEAGFDSERCCAGEEVRSYFDTDDYSPGLEMIHLAVQGVLYMILVVLTQHGVFNSLTDKIFNMNLKNKATAPSRDEIVRAEAVYVNKEIALPKKQIEDAKVSMLVNNVHKRYFKLIGKSCYAVQGLSFSVKKGECFGLLGVNGAGKSTTFKMLTAEECATKGDVYANGHFIGKNKGQYLRSLGYCPQFFGLDDFQTGRDNLTLLLTLRGLDADDVKSEVAAWIDIVGLEKYSRRKVSGYSGGCTRRLGTAAALCSGAPLTLLDEPTAGVDVAARRRVWSALRRSLRLQRSVVITSHSMDEMEALCSRIGIMSGGVLRALGTPAELRAAHAQGHAVVIKVKHNTRADEVDGGENPDIDRLKSALHSKFNCTLKDEHKTMLHYHINETMRYSDLFSELEKLKSTYPSLVEDYSVTETTLEEVFLAFAKENQAAQQQPTNGIV